MSSMNHRTWQTYHVGHFLTTVYLDPVAEARSIERHRELTKLTAQLVQLTDSLHLPTTWATGDPAQSAATSEILRSTVPHEFAILGDTNWVGPMAGRTRFARELSRRVVQARLKSLCVHAFVPRVAPVERDIDLVVKHDITAVAAVTSMVQAMRKATTPRAMHYGVWEMPVSAKMPMKSGWFSQGGWSTWRRIRAAARDAALFHLVIDAPALCEAGRAAHDTVARLLYKVAHLRDRGMVRVETLRETAARLSDVPAVKPQRSILRAA